MDNLGEMVSEVGDVVIIGRKCMNFRSLLCLKGKVEEMKMRGGKKKKRKEKKKKLSLQFLPRKKICTAFDNITRRKQTKFFLFCTYIYLLKILLNEEEEDSSSERHIGLGHLSLRASLNNVDGKMGAKTV